MNLLLTPQHFFLSILYFFTPNEFILDTFLPKIYRDVRFSFFSLKWSKHFLHSWISLSRVSFLFIHLWTSRNYLTIKTLDQNVKTDEASFREAFCKWVGIGKNKTAWHLPVSTEPLTSDCMKGEKWPSFYGEKVHKRLRSASLKALNPSFVHFYSN